MPRIIVDVHNWTWFTVDRAVGRNAPNDRLDVLLVQFLLFLATKSELAVPQTLVPQTLVPRGLRVATPLFRATTRAHPKPEGQIVIDGICGDQTIGFIEYYQESMQLRNEGWGRTQRPSGTAVEHSDENNGAAQLPTVKVDPRDARPKRCVPTRAQQLFLLLPLSAFGRSRADWPKSSRLRFRAVLFA